MTAPQDIRAEILLQLYAARPLAMSPELMSRQARKNGLQYTEAMVAAECVYLLDMGFVVETFEAVSGIMRYRITAQGVLQHERHG